MEESFQDYSLIQNFESQPKNAELGNYNSFADSFSDYLKTIDGLNLKLIMFCMHTTSFKTLISKFRILKFLDFHSCKVPFAFGLTLSGTKLQIIASLSKMIIFA